MAGSGPPALNKMWRWGRFGNDQPYSISPLSLKIARCKGDGSLVVFSDPCGYRVQEGAMSNAMSHSGKCFCGSVEFSVTGEPAAMGYCHCSSCRDWSAAPVNAFALWPLDAVKITKGADKIGTYRRTEKSIRK